MGNTSSIWKQIVAGVVSGLILLGLGWLGGVLPTFWEWVVSVASYVWSLLAYAIALPVWLLFLTAAGIVLVSWAMFRCRPGPPMQTQVTQAAPPPAEPDLRPLESDVVRALARADGARLTIDDLAAEIRRPRLLVEQAVEHLLAARLLIDNHNYVYGTSFRLSSFGRDLVIRHGYVAEALSAS